MKPRAFAPFVSVAALLCLSACDVDVFGLTEKKIAGGYRLYMGENGGFAVFAPGRSDGPGVIQVGWRKPFIIAVTHDGDWEVFDTFSGASNLFLTAQQVRADPKIRDIPLLTPDAAWHRLSHYRSQW
jgi:hypothetical protein